MERMRTTYFVGGRLVDGTGEKAVENAVLAVREGKILYAGAAEGAPEPAVEDLAVDVSGLTLLPGLFNCHAHLDLNLPYKDYKVDEFGPAYRAMVSYRRAAEALVNGVTTVRCVGMDGGADYAVKKAVEKGMLMGPRVLAAGPIIIATGGHGNNDPGSMECSGAAEFRRAARNELKKGADLIKIGLSGGLASPHEGIADKQMMDDEIRAVVEVAHGAGKKVAAHLGGDGPIRDAVRLGVDSVEHAYFMDKETAAMMAEAGTYLVPTLCVSSANEYLMAHGSPAYQLEKLALAQKAHKDSIRNGVRAGVTICCGTDLLPSDPFEGTTATIREVELFTEVGLSPLEAIRAATRNSAELCGVLAETGTLEAGKAADVIAVSGKPDERIGDLRNLRMVMKGGSLVRAELPGLKADFNPAGMDGELSGGTFITW